MVQVIANANADLPYDARSSATYIERWTKRIRDNPNCFFDACREGQKIADYLAERAKLVELPTKIEAPVIEAPQRAAKARDESEGYGR